MQAYHDNREISSFQDTWKKCKQFILNPRQVLDVEGFLKSDII